MGIRNVLHAGIENLTDRQRRRLERAFAADERHDEVQIAWWLAQQVRAVYHRTNLADGRKAAAKIADTYPSCPIPEIARTYPCSRPQHMRSGDRGWDSKRVYFEPDRLFC